MTAPSPESETQASLRHVNLILAVQQHALAQAQDLEGQAQRLEERAAQLRGQAATLRALDEVVKGPRP